VVLVVLLLLLLLVKVGLLMRWAVLVVPGGLCTAPFMFFRARGPSRCPSPALDTIIVEVESIGINGTEVTGGPTSPVISRKVQRSLTRPPFIGTLPLDLTLLCPGPRYFP
jgi:hypothetical protein